MERFGADFNKSKYILDNFERALSEQWIEVYFQPIVRTSNGRVCGEEALVRWDDPILGMMNPGEFVPTLEATNAIYKLDLFVLERVLEKMEEQRRRGLYVVPTSVNISQADFYSCDIVDEIAVRVEASSISKHMIAISVSEGAIEVGNDFVMSQLVQLQELGFQVWLDDYGSGDSALALLQMFHFDLLKINIYFVRQIVDSDSARIILTELVRMAMSLGMETVVEGVEYKEQVDFLNEIGCSRLQGFFYCKPLPISKVLERYEKGTAIGFENPEESAYYAAIGEVNLYDISFARNTGDNLEDYFDTFPVAIVESNKDIIKAIRSNVSFRNFVNVNFGTDSTDLVYSFKESKDKIGAYTMNSIRKCGIDGDRLIIDERTQDGKTVQLLIQRISVNPVTKVAAVAVVILQVMDKYEQSDNLTYNYIARALSEDYINLYYVNMDTDEFVEYNPDGTNRDVSVEKKGKDFFNKSVASFFSRIYPEDVDMMKKSFTKKKIQTSIEKNGSFTITYRRIVNDEPIYVNLKAVKVRTDENTILLGINNVDEQMKQRKALERIKEEQIASSRIMALSGDFICIYVVDLNTDAYICYDSTEEYETLNIAKEGPSFFTETVKNAWNVVYADDLKSFMRVFDKKTIMEQINTNGLFAFNYRLKMKSNIIHVVLKATIVKEEDGDKLIFGILNIENQVVREQEYANILLEAEDRAVKDQLTGVKNKRAYADEEDYLNTQIKAGINIEFALVVCDLNGLKVVNDTLGHKAGDEFIIQGCEIICDAFARSPVYRIGGDEFVVIAQGKDYHLIEKRIEKINKANAKNKKLGKVTIAVGTATFDNKDKFVSDVFERADDMMYKNKKKMKEGGK